MFGIILSLLYGAWTHFVLGKSNELTYLEVTQFLYQWYWVTSIILAVIMVLIAGAFLIGGAVKGADMGGKFGALFGFFAGGALSIFVLVLFVIKRGLFIGGTYLLKTALILNNEPVWDKERLIWGGLLLFIAIITRSKSNSSNSKNS